MLLMPFMFCKCFNGFIKMFCGFLQVIWVAKIPSWQKWGKGKLLFKGIMDVFKRVIFALKVMYFNAI